MTEKSSGGVDRRALVGRERELGELLAGLDSAVGGRGAMILVSGEQGVGKSRLIDELAVSTRARVARVLVGRCWEVGGAPPYWPWVQLIRAYVRDRELEPLAEEMGRGAVDIAQVIPEVRDLFPHLPEARATDPEAARFRLFDSMAIFLRAAARTRPLVIVIDDLQVADEPSLLLLRFLARELTDAHILVVGAYRDTDSAHREALTVALGELMREPVTRHLRLTPLSEREVARLIEASVGFAPPASRVAAVHLVTEGNPLFVGEVARLLAADGRLSEPADPSEEPLLIPESVRVVIGQRLARLSDECRFLLAHAAIFGREFRLDALGLVSKLRQTELLALVGEAEEARLVTAASDAPGWRRLSHALVRDVLYEELRPTKRLHAHREAGEALELLYSDDLESHVAEIAHHFLLAAQVEDVERAVEYARRAGARALELLAYEEAVRHFRAALGALNLQRLSVDETRCRLLLALGDAQARSGDGHAAKGTLLEAAAVARRLNAPEHFARAALGYGGRFVWEAGRGDEHLVPLLEEGVARLGEEDSLLRAKLLARLAGGPLRDDVDRSRRAFLSQQAVEIVRRIGDPATLAYVLDGRYSAIWWAENLEERLEVASELIEAAEHADDLERALQGHHYRLLCLLELGDMAGVAAELAAKVRIADELRQPAQEWYVTAVRMTLATFQGRYGEVEELIERAYQLGHPSVGRVAIIYRAISWFALRSEQGRLDEIVDDIEQAVEEFPTYVVLRCILARVYAELGREKESRRIFEALADNDFDALPRNEEWLFGMSLLPDVAQFLEDASRAVILYELLTPYADRNALSAIDACTGSVARVLGILDAILSRWDQAVAHFEAALEMNKSMGARPWVVHTQYDLARTLLSRNAAGDREVAVESLQNALATAQDLGMAALSHRCEALLRAEGIAVEKGTERITRTFMFTDIVGSTNLLEAIGDEGWHNLLRWHDETLRALFAKHRGQEVSHAGDGFFVSFADPGEAVRCGLEIQRRLAEHRRQHGFAPNVRIGLHTAEATSGESGFTGRGVHVAARIGALATGGEILASRATLDALQDEVKIREERKVLLKGIAEPVSVAAVDWVG